MDIVTPEQRSKNMSAIHSKNTRPEVYLRKLLFAQGYRYGLNSKTVPGHPDIYLRKYNTAIFVHGCFWHRHRNCKFAYMPKSRIEFWEKKFKANENRDIVVREELKKNRIKCLIVWECAIKQVKTKGASPDSLVEDIIKFIQSETAMYKEIPLHAGSFENGVETG